MGVRFSGVSAGVAAHGRSSPPAAPDVRGHGGGSAWMVRALILVYAASCFSAADADPDLWGHLRFGAEMWETGTIPRVDTHSYTAAGQPWINHEWLTEVLFHGIYTATGSTGLLVFKLGLGLLVIQLLTSCAFARAPSLLAYAACFLTFVLAIAPGFLTRPHLLSILFLTLMLTALQRFFRGRRGAIWWIPAVMLLWVNSHGGVIAGLGLLGVVVAVESARCWRTGERHWRPLVACLALSALAMLANPYGLELWRFFGRTVFTPRDIDEWAPIPLLSTSHWPFKLMALAFLGSLALPTAKRPWEIAIITIATLYGFKHQRHSVLAAIVMVPYLTEQTTAALRRSRAIVHWLGDLSPSFHSTVRALLITFILFQIGRTTAAHWQTGFRIAVAPDVYPVEAVRFMDGNGIDGDILVPFEWGEYVIWKRPASRVSIDGRFETVYPPAVIDASFDFMAGREGWRRIVDDYPPDIVLSRKSDHGHWLLSQQPGWQRIYEDGIAAIWVPVTEPPASLLRRARAGALAIDPGRPSTRFP